MKARKGRTGSKIQDSVLTGDTEGSDTREISYNVTEIQPEIQKSREIHGKS